MNDLSFDTVGLFRRELRDAGAVIDVPAWWRGTLPAS
jgi:hypothetical protein